MRRSLLSICGLVEESTEAGAGGFGALFVCPAVRPKGTISRASVVRARAGGRVIVGGYQRRIGIEWSWCRVATPLRTIPFTFVLLRLSRSFHDGGGRVSRPAQTRRAEMATSGAKARLVSAGYAALKRRFSTILRAFVWFRSSTGGSAFLLGAPVHFRLDTCVRAKVKVMGRNDTKEYGSRGGCFAVSDLVCRPAVHVRWTGAFFWRAAG